MDGTFLDVYLMMWALFLSVYLANVLLKRSSERFYSIVRYKWEGINPFQTTQTCIEKEPQLNFLTEHITCVKHQRVTNDDSDDCPASRDQKNKITIWRLIKCFHYFIHSRHYSFPYSRRFIMLYKTGV